MTDTARVLLVAACLSASALVVFAWRLTRIDPSHPDRLIGELRLAQFGAVLLALTGGAWLGLAVAARPDPLSGLDVSLGIAYALVAGIVLHLEPRQGLMVVAAAFVLHALIDIGHRPGWLSTSVAPQWFTAGCAGYDVFAGALCFWARRR